MLSSIYTRISNDVANIPIRHIVLDTLGRYSEDASSRLNIALTIEPNLDQGPRAFRRDIVNTMFEHGVAAIVPVDTTIDPRNNTRFDIFTMRVGRIIKWFPENVQVELYNQERGQNQEVVLPKASVAIVENPFINMMNEPNSILQRLSRKLTLLDIVDEATSSGKLDLIIQLPYVIKSEARAQQAKQRLDDIEAQLTGSKHGIAYTDGTEKVIQLNRPVENGLLAQVEFLTKTMYDQLGVTGEILNGTADEATMVNYYNRVVEPILEAITEAMNRSFLGPPTVRKNEKIDYFRDPFKLVTVKDLAEATDVFRRNEVLTPNEVRSFMGFKPLPVPTGDDVHNSNMPKTEGSGVATSPASGDAVNQAFDEIESELDSIFEDLGTEA